MQVTLYKKLDAMARSDETVATRVLRHCTEDELDRIVVSNTIVQMGLVPLLPGHKSGENEKLQNFDPGDVVRSINKKDAPT